MNNISVMPGLLQERGREKEEWDRLKGPNPHPNLTQVKQISYCQQAKYDRAISLKTVAESAPPYHKSFWGTYCINVLRHYLTIQWG